MTELDYQKELLKTKIEAHRTVLGLEVRAARLAFDPLGLALSLLGFDREIVKVLGPVLHAVAGSLGDLARPEEGDAAAEADH
ncbi:MAG: hypothetical protein JRG80_22090 [Deltaproteobacteria bacterium]|nr:hypothetical protein [Deltaproteobacteria bacterium]MBW2401909.1 hypothetical protein [Deltaproteobacteria bacterium]